ncbi:hypothetical protein G3N95_36115 [Paraburkholderia sp. Tr-20389]|uniref:hypothetical protein n=1 Tax=Paraburkholderia sp. Tr-20389 TaxID=2703903 RepID=UPI00197D57B9|nr:hypothetical protein [Paraburkholderia sp. Tr-20389]MBN3758382.1 hypothetical protein [Paraburkholderia sp. Tr-20389]
MWKHQRTRERDAATLPRFNGGITQAMLSGVPLAPRVAHGARGIYRVDPRYARRAKPIPVRLNSERDVLPPVDPLPASHARAARVFARIVREVTDGTARWTSRREAEARYRRACARIDADLAALALGGAKPSSRSLPVQA